MSSTYRILCVSHNPALDHGEYHSYEEAAERIAEGVSEHRDCDLVIGRYSYPLVEAACPPGRAREGKRACTHGGLKIIDADWLRLLHAARQSHDPVMTRALRNAMYECWPKRRLEALRIELRIGEVTQSTCAPNADNWLKTQKGATAEVLQRFIDRTADGQPLSEGELDAYRDELESAIDNIKDARKKKA